MRLDFSREEERAFTARIDRAIKAACQAAGKSSDARMVQRVFEVLAFDDLTSQVKHSQPTWVLVPGEKLARLYRWTPVSLYSSTVRVAQA